MIQHDMACAVCTYALNAIDDNGTVTYEHPVAPTSGDHDPVPVPAYQLPDVYRRCHLCSANAPVWMYRTPQIEALADGGTRPITQTYSTRWNVCCRCAALIEQDDHRTLTDASIAVMRWRRTDPRAQILAVLHRAIVLMREPGRTLLTTGNWSPAPLKASTLPKIRDRLTGLLRGPIGLPEPIDHAEPRRLIADGLDHEIGWLVPIHVEHVRQELTVNGDHPLAALVASWLITPTAHHPKSGSSASNRPPPGQALLPLSSMTAPPAAEPHQITATGSAHTSATRHTAPAAPSAKRSTSTPS